MIAQDALPPGTIWVDCTSGSPQTSKDLAESLAQIGVQFVDVAVSGGPAGAKKGQLTAMVGGQEAAVKSVTPVISQFASDMVHLGPAGSGHAVKAINNTLLAVNLLAVSEGMLSLGEYGVDPNMACKAISTS